MPDEPRPPHDTPPSSPEPSTEPSPHAAPPTDGVVLSFLEHLSKRRSHAATPPPSTPDVVAAITRAAQAHLADTPTTLNPDSPHRPAAATPSATDTDADADTDADDTWSSADKVINLDDIRRLRQHAADANLPESPLLRYLFEHLMPAYSGGPVNLEVRPEFLQEHARPLLSLLLQTVADSLDGHRVSPHGDAAPSSPAPIAPTATPAPADASDASDASPDAPDTQAPPADLHQNGEIKKSVSFNLDLSGLFRQLFSRKPPDGDSSP